MAKKSTPVIKPGETTPKSGQDEAVGPRAGRTGEESTQVKGNTAPPTPKPNQEWELVDPTKHKSDKK